MSKKFRNPLPTDAPLSTPGNGPNPFGDPAVAARETPLKKKPAAKPKAVQAGYYALDPFPAAGNALGAAGVERIVWGFILLGAAVRAVRYLLAFPLWPDESFLACNYLERGFMELLRPLAHHQVAPPLYLWLQKSILLVLGFSEYSLRSGVFLASLASLLLFRQIARRLLSGVTLIFAVGTFAVAYPLIRYGAEAKPYGIDVLVSLGLISLFLEWRARADQRRWWWALVAVLPLAVLLSYPAMFIAGAVMVAMALALVRRGGWKNWFAWLAVNASLAVGMAGLYFSSGHAQWTAAGPIQQDQFTQTFPPLHSAKELARFVLLSQTSEAVAYPVGGANGASALTMVCCLAGLFALLRARQWSLAALCVVPAVLNFIAAALRFYPYAGSTRLALFAAPVICLLAGLGAAVWFSLAWRARWSPKLPAYAAVALLAVIGLGASLRDFVKPYKETCWMRNRDLARWFWTDKAVDGELVCLHTDLQQEPYQDRDALASIYLCNQRIYSPRIAKGRKADLEHVSKEHPLRCARFHPQGNEASSEAAFQRWLQGMMAKYELVGRETYPMTFAVHESTEYVDQIELYEFIPRSAPITASRNLPAAR